MKPIGMQCIRITDDYGMKHVPSRPFCLGVREIDDNHRLPSYHDGERDKWVDFCTDTFGYDADGRGRFTWCMDYGNWWFETETDATIFSIYIMSLND